MTDKEKADIFIELHKTQLDHFEQTRDIEFKVNLALWTLIAASGAFLYGKIRLTDTLSVLFYLVIAVFIFVGHMVLWMMPIQNTEDTDDHFINEYRHAVEMLVGIPIPKPSLVKSPKRLWNVVKDLRKDGWSWILAESGITLALLIVVGILLWWK